MSRRVILLLLALAFLAAPGCGPGGRAPAGSGIVTVTFWQFWEGDVIRPILDRFEAENPGIKVEMQQLTWQNGRERILAAVAAGNTPDLCELGSTWFGRFATDGVLADITADVDTLQPKLRQWGAASHDGRIYGVPWVLGTRAMFYNKALFRKAGLDPGQPPETWPRLMEAARRIHDSSAGVYGFGRNTGERYILFKKFMPLAWGNGGDVLSPDGATCVFDSPANREALQFFLDLGPYSLTERQDLLDQAFKQGKVGVIQSGAWLFKTLPTDAPDLEYGVCRMPRPDEARGANRSFGGGEVLVIFRNSPRKAAALKLAAFLARGDNALALSKAAKSVQPAAVGLENDPYYREHPGERVFLDQLSEAVFPPNHPDWQEIENSIESWVEKAIYGQVDAAGAVAGASRDIDALLKSHAGAGAK